VKYYLKKKIVHQVESKRFGLVNMAYTEHQTNRDPYGFFIQPSSVQTLPT